VRRTLISHCRSRSQLAAKPSFDLDTGGLLLTLRKANCERQKRNHGNRRAQNEECLGPGHAAFEQESRQHGTNIAAGSDDSGYRAEGAFIDEWD
jgi:hypothetical protein